MDKKRLVVIGGGAAGFFCAVNAARLNTGMEVIILEKSGKFLSKVRISGGGRCNLTHSSDSVAEMVRKYPRGSSFLKKSFQHFFTNDTVRWFQDRGLALKTEQDGRMFPVTDSSASVVDCLVKEANCYGVIIRMNAEVKQVNRQHDAWILDLGTEKLTADYICIACGGYPKSSMFEWLNNLGHTIIDPQPSLFSFNMPGNPITALMGLSVERASLHIAGTRLREEGPLLITHWGMSGPAILRLSAWGARELSLKQNELPAYHFNLMVNWLPDYNENSLRDFIRQLRFEIAPQKITNRNHFQLPQRLWDFILQASGIPPDMRWADLPARQQNLLVKHLTAQEFEVKGKTTFKEEFVTAGGIHLSEIDPNTMGSKLHPNLYFAGEIMDVDGITGGFNFQHAWTSGWIAANSIAGKAG